MTGKSYGQQEATTFMKKNGKTYPVPYHGSKEMSEPLRKKIIKEMGLK